MKWLKGNERKLVEDLGLIEVVGLFDAILFFQKRIFLNGLVMIFGAGRDVFCQ